MSVEIKSYDFIISLGLNCETAFQIHANHGFVESSLLTWTTISAPALPILIQDNSRVFSGHITPLAEWNMFKCDETQAVFHGRANPAALKDASGKIPAPLIAQEQAECVARVRHLAKKENDLKSSQATKLYVVGMHQSFLGDASNKLSESIGHIYTALAENSVNSQLLVILQEDQRDLLRKDIPVENIFIRFIKEFAPFNMATVADQNDMTGYSAIFSEFVPKIGRSTAKTFKFES